MRYLIVSNRLPFAANFKKSGGLEIQKNSGGLVSSLNSFLENLKINRKKNDYLWIGWSGTDATVKEQIQIVKKFRNEENSIPIFLPKEIVSNFYDGFCNKVIWPLFHYFPSYTVFDEKYWEDYVKVNRIFADKIIKHVREDDLIWIHDYHLMLVPKMVREKFSHVKIGFFLHIPFPSFEIFRLLPSKWRKDILLGLLGADLIGFHTYDYTQYFSRAVSRILGYEYKLGRVILNERINRIDTFPLGIDFQKFYKTALNKEVDLERKKFQKNLTNYKTVLAIDRLDYSKGVLKRLEGYERFLEKNKKWLKKVILILVSVPSRIEVDQYQIMKKQMEELIGKINGRFGTIDWTPISYQYKSLTFNQLVSLYKYSDVALITPLRDGMNLVAKEYVASRVNKNGVLILSEMAGAAKELSESMLINPNSTEEIADAIDKALKMPKKDQSKKILKMQERLKRYDVFKWADDFITKLNEVSSERKVLMEKLSLSSVYKKLLKDYVNSKKRLILLDYDGTLQAYTKKPYHAKPSSEISKVLKKLSSDRKNEVVILSARDKEIMENWFGKLALSLVAENGLLLKDSGTSWKLVKPITNTWKSAAINILSPYVDQVPGSYIEEKDYSVAWHFEESDLDQANLKSKELIDDLSTFISNTTLEILPGKLVIEVKDRGVDKSTVVLNLLNKGEFDFILAVGDDLTDEDLFSVLPESAYSIKVGTGQTQAKYNIASSTRVLNLLSDLTAQKSK